MRPYYEDDAVTIYHGDCREILPTLPPVDLVLTDPPYGLGEAAGKNKSRAVLATVTEFGYAEWDNTTIPKDLIDKVRSGAPRQIIFGGNFYELPPSSCWLVWDKDNGGSDFADCELAWTNLSKAVRLIRWRWAGMLQENMGDKEFRFHPTQKPVPVMRWCIQQAGEGVNTILDPFMGSGTTLRAAKDLGRRAIGIEIEERYCEVAAQRMAQSVLAFDAV
jgi:DNA modification methylase